MAEQWFLRKMMNKKHDFVFQICERHGLGTNNFYDTYLKMWQNPQKNGGFRLTETGYKWLCELEIKNYAIPVKSEVGITANIILGLDRFLLAPYYMKSNKLYIFDDNFSTQLLLYDGNLDAFIKAQKY